MSFCDTGLIWVPTSPNIPTADTALYYPLTGIIGEAALANIGIGSALPFRLIGAPWIAADLFAKKLNALKLKGIHFHPFHFVPHYGSMKNKSCHGVLLTITNRRQYEPIKSAYLILSVVKALYPHALSKILEREGMFTKVNGSRKIYRLLTEEKYPGWKMVSSYQKSRAAFIEERKSFLIY
jgi:Uncharacterized protein conserved in bacteria